jgi:hypothetical protein
LRRGAVQRINDSGLIDGIRCVLTGHQLRNRVLRLIQADEPFERAAPQRSRLSRFVLIMTVASMSWLVPALVAYWFIVPR